MKEIILWVSKVKFTEVVTNQITLKKNAKQKQKQTNQITQLDMIGLGRPAPNNFRATGWMEAQFLYIYIFKL